MEHRAVRRPYPRLRLHLKVVKETIWLSAQAVQQLGQIFPGVDGHCLGEGRRGNGVPGGIPGPARLHSYLFVESRVRVVALRDDRNRSDTYEARRRGSKTMLEPQQLSIGKGADDLRGPGNNPITQRMLGPIFMCSFYNMKTMTPSLHTKLAQNWPKNSNL